MLTTYMLFLLRPEQSELELVKVVLQHMFGVTGLKVNPFKSSCFSLGITRNDSLALANELGCTTSDLPEPYLGKKLHHSNPTKTDFLPLIQKINRFGLESLYFIFCTNAGQISTAKSWLAYS